MATKSNKKTNTRVSKKSKGPAPHLKIWVGVLVVLIVAVVGVLIVRFSEAAEYRIAYCKQGDCKLTKTNGYQKITVKVLRDYSCKSTYKYTSTSVPDAMADVKKSKYRCLGK